ncbi:hypothetical protein GCM10007052_28310 [Halioglobus japonicus]|nr:hypothetical protein GCM10007052_28310 [Halioglobus japonicus]
MAAHEMRSTAAHTIALSAGAQRSHHLRVGGKPEVVITAEIEIFAPIDPHPRALARFQGQALAIEIVPAALRQDSAKALIETGHGTNQARAAS